MTEIIEHNDDGARPRAVSQGASDVPLSIKQYQDIYHRITGKTEQIRSRYTDNLLVDFGELEQLNYKIMQLCDVHQVVASNQSVSVFHAKERKEQFTSFTRFKNYNANKASPTLSVVLKYNFSIIPAGGKLPQEYVVTMRLTSRVAATKHLEEESPPFMRGRIYAFMVSHTAEVTVDYVDYVIARGFIEAFDEWIKGCKCSPTSPLLVLARTYSHHIPDACKLLVTGLIIFFALRAVPEFFSPGSAPSSWARFMIIYSGISYLIIKGVEKAASQIEVAIDTYPEMSYLNLNRGDEKLISDSKDAKPWALLRFAVGVVLTIALGILSSKLEKLI